MYGIIFAFITSFGLTYLIIPLIIRVAEKNNFIVSPGGRRSHHMATPTLGGFAIFAGTLVSLLFWMPKSNIHALQYIFAAFVIIILIGIKDDIRPLSPVQKLIGQITAAALIVCMADIRITGLFGLLGFYAIPGWFSIALSIFTIVVIINAFNLIDGIDGLSASVGILITSCLGFWFILIGRADIAIIAFSVAGATIAFLKFNITPAKIFMGDTGSLLLGLVCAVLAILFIETHHNLGSSPYAFKAAPSVAFGMLILPLFDTLRIFITRVLNGKSPFDGDKNHIHHLLLETGMSHMQGTFTLLVVNLIFILIAVRFQDLGVAHLLLLIVGVAWGLSAFLSFVARQHRGLKKYT